VVVGAVEGVVKAKVPSTLAAPPERVEFERVWPTRIAEAVGGVVMVGVARAMLKLNEALPESVALLVAVMTRVEFPAAVGVPVMAPVVALRVSPAGREALAEKMFGPLVAVTFWEKATPTVPTKVAPVTIGAPETAAVTFPLTGTSTFVAPVLERVMLPEGVPTGAEAARRMKRELEALPPDWGMVAVEAKEELFVETSKLAGAVAVMLAVKLVPLTVTDWAAEAVPLVVVKGERVPLVERTGVGVGVEPIEYEMLRSSMARP
jgi:hypothetical protein